MNYRNLLHRSMRVVYDMVFVNVAMVLAIYVHYLTFLFRKYDFFTFEFYFEHTGKDLVLWQKYALVYTLLMIVIFYIFGFYNGSRFKRFRMRVVFILQGIIVSNLALLLIMHLSYETYRFPRGVTILFFCFSFAFLVVPRIFKPLLYQLSLYLQSEEKGSDTVRKVLVVGGAGYLGSVLVRYLLSKGYQVNVLDLMLFGSDAIDDLKGAKRFKIFKGDFRHLVDLLPAMKGVDAVVHLGAIVGDPACAVDDDFTVDVNLAATEMLCNLCKTQGIKRFVFASTCSVYGISDEILNETSKVNPVSLYARTKVDAEKVILGSKTRSFHPTSLRFSTVFGLSPRPRFDIVLNTFVAHAMTKKKLTVFGANQWRPFVHPYDIARSIEAVLDGNSSKVSGQIFNVGDDHLNYTIGQIADIVAKRIGDVNVENHGDVPDPRNYRVSFEKIQKVLGFRCEKTLDQGVDEMVSAFEKGQIKSDVASERYSNFVLTKKIVENHAEVARNFLYKSDILMDGYTKDEFDRKTSTGGET